MTNFQNIDQKVNGIEYVLRISVPYCNLKCDYCRKENFNIKPIDNNELIDIIRVSVECGIKKVRWTGGEPTIIPNYIDLVKKTREIGIEKQMLSTNGTILYRIAEELKDAGINRVNISLDTLDRYNFLKITGKNMLHKVLQSLDVAVNLFELVKINRVLEKLNLDETIQLIELAEKYQTKKAPLVIRFIELVKGGFDGDIRYVKDNYCAGEEVIKIVKDKYGNLSETKIEGDNPMCYYYKINSNGVVLGIVPNFSVNFQCGGKKCKKLRVNPVGFVSNCSIYQEFGHNLKGTTYKEKLEVMKHLIIEKQERGEETFKRLKHHQSDYQFWRFGKPTGNE